MIFDIDQTLENLDTGHDWVGLREVRETCNYVSLRDAKIQANATYLDHGLMVEVLHNGHFGYACTNRLDQTGVEETLASARQQAQASQPWACFRFNESVRPPSVGQYVSPIEHPLDLLSRSEQINLLKLICQRLRTSDRIVQAAAALQSLESEQNFVSTNGARTHQKLLIMNLDYRATARKRNLTQTRSNHGVFGHSFQNGSQVADQDSLLTQADIIGQQAEELLNAEDCPNESTTLVLAPDQMMLQIHESIGHPLEIDRILGDERNYAGSSFVKAEDFGELQYGSELMNVSFDPGVRHQLASYAFDDIGDSAHREYLIKDGKLLRGLGSLESQTRASLAGVANARASSWNRAPIDRMANINLEAGDTSFDDLIASVESGVYMETNRSWSIDDYRNKFQFGCEYAKRIENGKLTSTLRDPNYRGITNDFWGKLCMLGNADTFEIYGTPYCGKGEPNQLIRVGHASPVCAFKDIEVFGADADA